MSTAPRAYPSDISDGESEFLLPCLTLMREDAPQWEHELVEVFNALLHLVKTGFQWHWLPHDFPPWNAVYQQARRWVSAKVFEEIVHELLIVVRLVDACKDHPTAAIFDARTQQSIF